MSNLYSLPPSILHKILSKVATSHMRDFGSARIAFRGFNQVGREDYFYRSADLIHFNDWIEEVNAVRKFRLLCYQAGNLEAIYMRGMSEFFILHLLDQGREKIRLAAERGLLLAKYVDGMLNLAFSVDDAGLVHNYPNFTREFVHRMEHLVGFQILEGHWVYDKPEVFMSAVEEIKKPWSLSHDCCSTPSRCDRCFWQNAVWDFCSDIHITAADWPMIPI